MTFYNKSFLVVLPQRDAQTLEPLIEDWIEPRTHITSDGWAAYNRIKNLGHGAFSHDVIVHQQNFVDPNDPSVHTQSVESMWSRAKRMIRNQYGTSRYLFEAYLPEFMWIYFYSHKSHKALLLEQINK